MELLRLKMDKLQEFEFRITVLENLLRDRQYRDLLARVERLEQLQ